MFAIDGRGGSGKSTLGGRIGALLDAPFVHMDDLYPGWDGLAEAASLLSAGCSGRSRAANPARYRRYDWVRDEYADWWTYRQRMLVVEGCAAALGSSRRISRCCSGSRHPRDAASGAGIARDGETFRPHWERWARQEDVLFAAEGTRDRADFRIDGAPTAGHDPDREVVLIDRSRVVHSQSTGAAVAPPASRA